MPREHYDVILEAARARIRHQSAALALHRRHRSGPEEQDREYFREEQVARARLKMKFPTPDYRGLASAPASSCVASDFRWVKAFPVLNDGSELDKMYKENAERILLQSVAAATMSGASRQADGCLGYNVWWVTAIGQEKAQQAMKPLLGIPRRIVRARHHVLRAAGEAAVQALEEEPRRHQQLEQVRRSALHDRGPTSTNGFPPRATR